MSNIVTYNDWFNVAPCVVDKTINPSGETIIDKNISPIPDTNDIDESYLQVSMNIAQHKRLNPVIDKVYGVQDCRDVVDGVQVYKAWEDAYPTNMTKVDDVEELYRDNIGEAIEEQPIEPVVENEQVVTEEKVEEIVEHINTEEHAEVKEEISETPVLEESPVEPVVEEKVEEVKPVIKKSSTNKKVAEKKTTVKKPAVKRTTKKKETTVQEVNEKEVTVPKPRKSARKTTKAKENK